MKSSREQFEEWVKAETGFDLYRTNFPMTSWDNQQYKDHSTNLAWMSWQASRAAIEVELPKYHELTTHDTISARAEKSTYNFGIYDSADAIRAAGLTVKGDA